jgi:hypothetical protein
MARRWRRWAFESAALDLALAQAKLGLPEALGREPAPVRFVNSLGLGDPPAVAAVGRRLVRYPGLRFKLDAQASWSPSLAADVAATGVVGRADRAADGRLRPRLPRLSRRDRAAGLHAGGMRPVGRDRAALGAGCRSRASLQPPPLQVVLGMPGAHLARAAAPGSPPSRWPTAPASGSTGSAADRHGPSLTSPPTAISPGTRPCARRGAPLAQASAFARARTSGTARRTDRVPSPCTCGTRSRSRARRR